MATIAPKIDGATKGDLTGIIRWEVNKKSITTKNSFSTSIEVKGIPWAVGVSKRNNYLSVSFHTLDGDYSVQNVEVKSEYKLINHEDDGKTITRKANYSCEKQMTWGFERFINWKDAVAKDKGFVKDNKLTVQVEFWLSEIVVPRRRAMEDSDESQSMAIAPFREGKSAVEGKGGVSHGSPPQSVLEEYESEEEQLQYPKRGTGQMSIVEEERSDEDASTNGLNESRARLNFSAEFGDGADLLKRINEYEQNRREADAIMEENDSRFNNTFNAKRYSWEPSPNQSTIEESGDEASVPNQGADSSILQNLDSSKLKRPAASKSVKFAEKNEIHTLPPVTSSASSTSTLARSDERLDALHSSQKGDSSLARPSVPPMKKGRAVAPLLVPPSLSDIFKYVQETGCLNGDELIRGLGAMRRKEKNGAASTQSSSVAPPSSSSQMLSKAFVTGSSLRETTGRSGEYEREKSEERLPEVSMESGREKEKEERRGKKKEITQEVRQSRCEEETRLRRKDVKNSSMASSISTASSRSDGMRVESRAESVASNTSAASRASASGNGRENAIITDQSVLNFGYVDEGDTKVLTFKGRNVLSFPITCAYALKLAQGDRTGKKHSPRFMITSGSETIVEPGQELLVKVKFLPNQAASFYDILNIRVTGGGISMKYSIKIFGSGGSANLLPMERNGLVHHRDTGDFSLQPNHSGLLSLGIQNAGKRSAFVRVVVVDDKEQKVEGITFTPSHSFVIPAAGHQGLKLDLTNARCLSSIGTSRGMGSHRGSFNILPPSATRSSADYTIKLYWGEETQRVRMVAWCKQQKHSSFPPCCPIDEDFSLPFVDSAMDNISFDGKRLSKMDCDNFIASLRTTFIDVHLPRRSSQTPMDDDSDMDRTLMPDDTYRGANETMVSMAADLTPMKIRR